MKNIGIWIDKEKAHIVTLDGEKESFQTILSDLENFRPHGGSGTRQKGGPQDVVQDSKYLEREKQQLKNYFKEIASEISETKNLVIFGPAGTNEKLRDELHNNYKLLGTKIKGVKKADSMTNNQLIAWVKNFFESN